MKVNHLDADVEESKTLLEVSMSHPPAATL